MKNRWTVVLLMASVAVMAVGLTPWARDSAVAFWGGAFLLELVAVVAQLKQQRRSGRDVRRRSGRARRP
jgi:hypothetical protein